MNRAERRRTQEGGSEPKGPITHDALTSLVNDRIAHFARRLLDRGQSPTELVIVAIHAEDPVGRELAAILTPDFDWRAVLALGQVPVSCGLVERAAILKVAEDITPGCTEKLPFVPADHVLIVSFAQESAKVWAAELPKAGDA